MVNRSPPQCGNIIAILRHRLVVMLLHENTRWPKGKNCALKEQINFEIAAWRKGNCVHTVRPTSSIGIKLDCYVRWIKWINQRLGSVCLVLAMVYFNVIFGF